MFRLVVRPALWVVLVVTAIPSDTIRAQTLSSATMAAPRLIDYSAEAFDSARAAGKTTLVFFHAPWCPVCRAQEPKILTRLAGAARHVVAFKVDHDSHKALRTTMGVLKQSTVVMFKGTTEVARLSYASDDASMDAFFSHAAMDRTTGGAR